MDAIDILGGLLGGKSSGGLGGKILKDILSGGRSSAPAPVPRNTPSPNSPAGSRSSRPVDIDQQADALEDLLNVANKRQPESRQPQTPSPHRSTNASSSGTQDRSVTPPTTVDPVAKDSQSQNQRAELLIRAMVRAARADGKLSEQERQSLFQQVGQDPAIVQRLEQEWDRKESTMEFTWSVPQGMEQQVYSISLAVMEPDNPAEIRYLQELAHGLRISPEVQQAIQQRWGKNPFAQ